MIPSLLLLSASVVASPVILSEVKATREAGHLRVEVRADGGIDPEAARTRIDQGSLYLFLGGTRVKADNRAWKLDEGVGEIRAHRHHTETELDVPLLGNGCSGPVELQGNATGLTALVGCEGATTAMATRPAGRSAAKENRPQETEKLAAKAVPAPVENKVAAVARELPSPATKPAVEAASPPARTTTGTAEAAALKNLVALPPADDDEAGEKPADVKAAAKDSTAQLAKDATKEDATAAVVERQAAAAAVKTELPAARTAPSLELPAPVAEPAKAASVGPSGFRAVGMPALFLAGLAIAAYVFARKKRGLGNTRRIQILETASLGQKRSLVIARVGDETLVLGASEAGITLLQAGDGSGAAKLIAPASAPGDAAPAVKAAASSKLDEVELPNELDQSLVDALADVPEPDGIAPAAARGSFRSIEGGLASLFGRKAAATAAARIEPKASAATTFDDLLEDSVEDQELRRKLAAGMSARVR